MEQRRIEPELVSEWVRAALQKPLPAHVAQLETLSTQVYQLACQAGFLEPRMMGPGIPASPSVDDIPDQLQTAIREVVWRLVRNGVIVPGTGCRGANCILPFFTVTEWGKKCLVDGEYLPHDAGLYLHRLDGEISAINPTMALDSVVRVYVTESLLSFSSGVYLSSAVMTGVAAERVLILVRDAVEAALPTPDRKKKFANATAGKPIKRVFEEIWQRLDASADALARGIGRDDVKTELSGIFDLIRKTRNDAGHPTGRAIPRDEAHALLLLFPEYCETAYRAIERLKSNPLP